MHFHSGMHPCVRQARTLPLLRMSAMDAAKLGFSATIRTVLHPDMAAPQPIDGCPVNTAPGCLLSRCSDIHRLIGCTTAPLAVGIGAMDRQRGGGPWWCGSGSFVRCQVSCLPFFIFRRGSSLLTCSPSVLQGPLRGCSGLGDKAPVVRALFSPQS